MDLNSKLLDFIEHSPTAFHAAANIAAALTANGYHELLETEVWTVSPGAPYAFVNSKRGSLSALTVTAVTDRMMRNDNIIAKKSIAN